MKRAVIDKGPARTELLEEVTTVDGLLPAGLARQLEAQVVAVARSPGSLWWYQFHTPPRTLFEQVIFALRPHVPHGGKCVGAEWWMRVQEADRSFLFHFDRDEAVKDSVVSPRTSSILYLSDVGGPTLIVDHEPGGAAPLSARAVHPRHGRFATFPGTLFHGVLPGSSSCWPRVAMFVNWWEHKPRAARADLAPAILAVSPLASQAPVLEGPQAPRGGPVRLAAADIMPAEKWLQLSTVQTQDHQRT
jgi:hypothetical protein